MVVMFTFIQCRVVLVRQVLVVFLTPVHVDGLAM